MSNRANGSRRTSAPTTSRSMPTCPDIDVTFVGPPDYKFNAIGARGVGEIGNTGIAAAIGNAVYHATGVRIRELPITPDKILSALQHEGIDRIV